MGAAAFINNLSDYISHHRRVEASTPNLTSGVDVIGNGTLSALYKYSPSG